MAFCNECGAKNSDDMSFCAECGHPLNKATATEEVVFSPAPSPIIEGSHVNSGDNSVLKTAAYFWYLVLYSVPFVGWLACIIISFAVKNKNLRNFSRAILISLLIVIAFWVIAYLALPSIIDGCIIYIETTLKDMPAGAEADELRKALEDLIKAQTELKK